MIERTLQVRMTESRDYRHQGAVQLAWSLERELHTGSVEAQEDAESRYKDMRLKYELSVDDQKFMELVFFKYLYVAIVVANGFGAFLVDTDVVFLQDPYVGVEGPGDHDIWIQYERPGCSEPGPPQ